MVLPTVVALVVVTVVVFAAVGRLVVRSSSPPVTPSPTPSVSPFPTTSIPASSSSALRWTTNQPAYQPRARYSAAMAYDTTTRGAVLYGGYGNTFARLNDTWIWDGETWRQMPERRGPTIGPGASMAYDPTTKDVVLVGRTARTGDSIRSSTWTWDGEQWVAHRTAGNAATHTGASMAYDASANEMVLFGGDDSNQTWLWNGSAWNRQTPELSPPPSTHAPMAYDGATGIVLLYDTSGSGSNGTWAWNGTNWVQVSSGTVPPSLDYASMVYNQAAGNVVMFGGDLAGASDETWIWNGTGWTEASPATNPPPRVFASMVYDKARSNAVLFGGAATLSAFSQFLGDTWTWNGDNWTEEVPTVAPPGRYGVALAEDPTSGSAVEFGGAQEDSDSGGSDDTWTWGGGSWTKDSPASSPSPRHDAAMAYDPVANETVLFGGAAVTNAPLEDTWTWNGTTWEQQFPPTSPPTLAGAAMAYDPATQTVVLFGGRGNGPGIGLSNATWTWNGSTWSERSPTTSPPAVRRLNGLRPRRSDDGAVRRPRPGLPPPERHVDLERDHLDRALAHQQPLPPHKRPDGVLPALEGHGPLRRPGDRQHKPGVGRHLDLERDHLERTASGRVARRPLPRTTAARAVAASAPVQRLRHISPPEGGREVT